MSMSIYAMPKSTVMPSLNAIASLNTVQGITTVLLSIIDLVQLQVKKLVKYYYLTQ